MTWLVIWKFLKGLPWQLWAFLALVGLFWWYGQLRYDAGQAATQQLWDAAKAKQASQDAKLKDKQAEVTTRVETKYVDRVRVVREKGDAIVREVKVYVPSDACSLPPGFRVYHDAAAKGEVPDPLAVADAAPIAAQDVAATVADNYLSCRLNAESLIGLQEWVRQQQALSEQTGGVN